MACFDAACKDMIYEEYRSRIRGPYVRFCERDEAVTPHPTRLPASPRPVSRASSPGVLAGNFIFSKLLNCLL